MQVPGPGISLLDSLARFIQELQDTNSTSGPNISFATYFICDVLKKPEFNADYVDHYMHERLMCAVEHGEMLPSHFSWPR